MLRSMPGLCSPWKKKRKFGQDLRSPNLEISRFFSDMTENDQPNCDIVACVIRSLSKYVSFHFILLVRS